MVEIGKFIIKSDKDKELTRCETRYNTALWLFLQHRISNSILRGFVASHTRFVGDARSIHITFDIKTQKVKLHYRRTSNNSYDIILFIYVQWYQFSSSSHVINTRCSLNWILQPVYILVIVLCKCISRAPWSWPFERWNIWGNTALIKCCQ